MITEHCKDGAFQKRHMHVNVYFPPQAAVSVPIQPPVAWLLDQDDDSLAPVERQELWVG